MSEVGLDFLIALEVEVTRQGGVRLPDTCDPVSVVLQYDHSKSCRPQRANTNGCGEHSIFVAPYDDEDARWESSQGFIRFCAFCDGSWRWPRFKGVI